jgi:hypothetical protein
LSSYKKAYKKKEDKILATAAKSILPPNEHDQFMINTLINNLSVTEMKKTLLNA